jgi:hypothetical protein
MVAVVQLSRNMQLNKFQLIIRRLLRLTAFSSLYCTVSHIGTSLLKVLISMPVRDIFIVLLYFLACKLRVSGLVVSVNAATLFINQCYIRLLLLLLLLLLFLSKKRLRNG